MYPISYTGMYIKYSKFMYGYIYEYNVTQLSKDFSKSSKS